MSLESNDADHLEELYQGALNRASAEGPFARSVADLAANTALANYVEKLDAGEEIRNPMAYVKQSAWNCARNLMRAAKRRDRGLFGTRIAEDSGDPLVEIADEELGPEDRVIANEMIAMNSLALRCTCCLLEQKDAEFFLRIHSGGGSSVGDLARDLGYNPDAFTKKRYRIEKVFEMSYRVIWHPRLMPKPRGHFVNCVERRAGRPDSEIEAEIEEALEWLRQHFRGDPTAKPELIMTLLSNTWANIATRAGRPGLMQTARRRLLAAAAAYVVLEDDAKPDSGPDGFDDDYEVVRAVRRAFGMDALGAGGTTYHDLG